MKIKNEKRALKVEVKGGKKHKLQLEWNIVEP